MFLVIEFLKIEVFLNEICISWRLFSFCYWVSKRGFKLGCVWFDFISNVYDLFFGIFVYGIFWKYYCEGFVGD